MLTLSPSSWNRPFSFVTDAISNFPFSNLLPHHLVVSCSQENSGCDLRNLLTSCTQTDPRCPCDNFPSPIGCPQLPNHSKCSPPSLNTVSKVPLAQHRPVIQAAGFWGAILWPLWHHTLLVFSSACGSFSIPVLRFPSLSASSIFLKALPWPSFFSLSQNQAISSATVASESVHKLMISK